MAIEWHVRNVSSDERDLGLQEWDAFGKSPEVAHYSYIDEGFENRETTEYLRATDVGIVLKRDWLGFPASGAITGYPILPPELSFPVTSISFLMYYKGADLNPNISGIRLNVYDRTPGGPVSADTRIARKTWRTHTSNVWDAGLFTMDINDGAGGDEPLGLGSGLTQFQYDNFWIELVSQSGAGGTIPEGWG